MAVVATTTYLYANTSLNQFYVQGSQLVDRGAWSSSAFYNTLEVVEIGVDLYIALQPNTNAAPTGVVDENWSSLVVVEEQSTIVNAGSDYYARLLATEALTLAQTGTAMVIAETGSRIATDNFLLAAFGSITADTVLYGRSGYANVGAALDALFYVYPTVTAFTNDVGTIELGNTVTAVNLAWSYNKAITSQVIDQGIGSVAYALRVKAQSPVAYTNSVTYTLTASDGANVCNGNTTVSFMQKRYWGNSALSSLTDGQIVGLSGEFASSRVQSKTVSPSGQYVYFAYPASFGSATFTVNGLLNTDWSLVTRVFVNASGYSDTYNIYRSNNLLTGTYQIAIS